MSRQARAVSLVPLIWPAPSAPRGRGRFANRDGKPCVRAEIDFYQTKLTRARTYSYIIIFPLLIYKLVLFIDLSQ